MDTLIGEYRYLSPIAMSIKFMMTFKVSANLREKSSETKRKFLGPNFRYVNCPLKRKKYIQKSNLLKTLSEKNKRKNAEPFILLLQTGLHKVTSLQNP